MAMRRSRPIWAVRSGRLIAMKLTVSQDRDAIGAGIEGGHRADCLCGLDIELKLAAIL